jgi:F1F0 ATPase subunit 2
MMTNNGFGFSPQFIAVLLLAFAAGSLLSIFYFGGLWLTIQRLDRSRQPALLFAGSFLLRLMVVLAGFYLVADGNIERLGVCLFSFFITRHVVLKRVQVPEQKEHNQHGF